MSPNAKPDLAANATPLPNIRRCIAVATRPASRSPHHTARRIPIVDFNTITERQIPHWLRRPRTQHPRVIILHGTRGPTTLAAQYGATVNWFTNSGNGRSGLGWGSQADAVVGTRSGEITFFGDYRTSRPNWSAGFGGNSATTWGADEWALSLELAHRALGDPFHDEVIENALVVCRHWMQEFGIPATHIAWDQLRSEDVPHGLIGHDETANGHRLGKSDPGHSFPWNNFLRRLRTGADIPTLTTAASPAEPSTTSPAQLPNAPRTTDSAPASVPTDTTADVWDAIRHIEERLDKHEHTLQDFPTIRTSAPR